VGAGVIGGIYAHLLAKGGNDVTLVARGARLSELRQHGLRVCTNGVVETVRPRVIDDVPTEGYDLVLVAVRYDQAAAALAPLASTGHRTIVTMINTPDADHWATLLGPSRLIPAFPGAGGHLKDGVIYGGLTPPMLQKTTIGELDGRRTQRLEELVSCLEAAGVPVDVCSNMSDWLLSHLALVVPLADAVYSGAPLRPRTLSRCAQDLKDSFSAVRANGRQILPRRYRILRILPGWLTAPGLGVFLRSGLAKAFVLPHALQAREEMGLLREAFHTAVTPP